MPYLNETFNASDEPESSGGDFDLLPNGIYPMEITDSDIKDTKARNGQYIEFEITITGPKFNGRKLWDRLNIVNPNTKAVEIARAKLAELCKACGKGTINQTEELHGIPFKGQVVTNPAKGGYPASNAIRKFMPAAGGSISSSMPEKEVPEVPTDAPWG